MADDNSDQPPPSPEPEWADVDVTPPGWSGYGQQAIGDAIAAVLKCSDVVRVVATRHKLTVRMRDDAEQIERTRRAAADCAPEALKRAQERRRS